MTTYVIRNVAVEVEGEGQAVVCIHGLGGSSNNWTPVLSAFDGMKVVRPELPGSARSALPSQPLSIELYVETLAGVLSELGMSKAHIVAHSMGTIVAQHLAIRYPELVKSLALFGPLLAPPEQGRPGIRARAALSREKGIAGVQEIADAIVKGATSAETKAQRPVTIALIRESVMRQSPEGYAQSCEALAGALPAEVERIAVPTLLVTGDEDGVGQPAAVTAMGERIAGSKVTILAGCGHWTTFEKPAECATELKAFYKSIQ
ncbi:alpha/beta fold hydrolase [Paraburkholderia antibiotica]|uniref:Alpha/beta fold hydrolase n=1 Tax=Paraburkholderia antibiotica TaxID=2728839 RepID=A0A7Y0FGK0_9BURK|nr:alpha/beta fold hydrolase [Paraburkholderia antibiotica]NML35105.1 alpha/beta fold hydrolase [Paraburkholderia antibiotica]